MLEPFLQAHALWVDEINYQVKLFSAADRGANRAFEETKQTAGWFAEIWRSVFRSKLRHFGVRMSPNALVLDVCCGSGHLGSFIEEKYGSETVFCDLSHVQLRSLTANRQTTAELTKVCEADVGQLPFATSTFDFVVGNSFLHHTSDVPAVLGELNRVLKPGGTLLFLHEPGLSAPFWQSFPWSLIRNTTPTGIFTDLWRFSQADLQMLLENANFSTVQVRGTGIVSSVVLNWYLILAMKLRSESKRFVQPVYRMRTFLDRVESSFQRDWMIDHSPSLMIAAKKMTVNRTAKRS